ncbi:Serine carboxypeptidase S28 family protein [Euphorbia peplus]|nr:Serine carboxypeptidase S28 family protein [Euphorbia peplus]
MKFRSFFPLLFSLVSSFLLTIPPSSSSFPHTHHFITRFPSSSSIIHPEKLLSVTNNNNGLYKEKFYTQILDHFNFNPQSYQMFQQRYLINDTYWGGPKQNAPIFMYTGNEGDIDWFAQNTGFMFDIAPTFQALLVFVEHRYYGKSIPFGGDKEVAYENATTLGYLTSTQALADYATLITDLKANLSATDSPVVVFGGSYGGMLAAWFRLKYPHVTIGALASSAPILGFVNITSPCSFTDIVTNDFRSESENCYKAIKGSWQQIYNTAAQPGGLEKLRKSFKICKNSISAGALENWLFDGWVYAAMTDYPTPSNFMNPMPPYPVKQMCKAIDDPTTGNDTFAKLYGAASIYYNYSGTATCFDLDDHSDPHGMAAWSWQACTEMIMPTGGSNEESMFPAAKWEYNGVADMCNSFFGIDPRPNWIPIEFGAHDFKRLLRRFGSNIIFFNGLRDPWSGGGVLKDISESLIAIVAEKGAHHVDLRSATSEDPKWLIEVRKKENKIISKWLSEYYRDLLNTY